MAGLTDGSDIEEGIEFQYERGHAQEGRYTTAVSAGHEADVEDNVQAMFVPTPDELIRKLRVKPPDCDIPTPCRIQSAREEFIRNLSSWTPSSEERLTTRPKSALDVITDTICKPAGVVPPLALPDWHAAELSRKIPRIPTPKGISIYYTPGKLSRKLHRSPKVYSVQDPYNRERVVGSPYTALHDPHAKDFIKRPQTRRLLYSQGLINEKDEIMYSFKEFNKFRDYLRTLYADEVHEKVHVADDLWRAEQEQLKVIRKYLSSTEGAEAKRMEKLKRAQWLQKESREYNVARLVRKRRESEARLQAWVKEREVINTEKAMRTMERSRLQREKLQHLAMSRRQRVIQGWRNSVQREIKTFERRAQDKLIVKQAQENFLLEWMDAKINFSKERLERTTNINNAWHESLKSNARRRQRRMEFYRNNLPKIIKKRKDYEAYRWGLARKYFYIWLEKTRARRSDDKKDTSHESIFIRGATGTLEETLEFLRFQAGNEERLDTFILNILRLKEEIKRQLALEEEFEGEDHEDLVEQEVKKRLSVYYGDEELKYLTETQSRRSVAPKPKKTKSRKSTTAVESRKSLVERQSLVDRKKSTTQIRFQKDGDG